MIYDNMNQTTFYTIENEIDASHPLYDEQLYSIFKIFRYEHEGLEIIPSLGDLADDEIMEACSKFKPYVVFFADRDQMAAFQLFVPKPYEAPSRYLALFFYILNCDSKNSNFGFQIHEHTPDGVLPLNSGIRQKLDRLFHGDLDKIKSIVERVFLNQQKYSMYNS